MKWFYLWKNYRMVKERKANSTSTKPTTSKVPTIIQPQLSMGTAPTAGCFTGQTRMMSPGEG